MLTQCTALTHLDLKYNNIHTRGAERFAGVLAQCEALKYFKLVGNPFSFLVQERIETVWGVVRRKSCGVLTDSSEEEDEEETEDED